MTLTLPEREVQDYSAQFYQVRYSRYGLRYHAHLINWLVHDCQDGERGLDVGCGTGIVGAIHQGLQLTGIDLSPKMIELANRLPYKGRGIYQVMDATQMPEGWTGNYQYIICRSLLHHLPDHRQGLSEMHRVLKSGGRISFLETNKSAIASWIRGKTQHGGRFSTYHHSFKDIELLEDIRRWFIIDEVRYEGFLCYPLYGFPDIIDFQRWIPGNPLVYRATLGIDNLLSRIPCLKRLSWALLIRAHKV